MHIYLSLSHARLDFEHFDNLKDSKELHLKINQNGSIVFAT